MVFSDSEKETKPPASSSTKTLDSQEDVPGTESNAPLCLFFSST